MTDSEAIAFVVTDRIRELINNRTWFRSHVGWIPESQVENNRELRYLLKLRRTAKLFVKATPDPLDQFKSFQDWSESELAGAFGR